MEGRGGWWEVGPLLALQHVVVALVVVVVSMVIEIRTVIGGRYQGEGPFVVFGVQWFLLNVMPAGGRAERRYGYNSFFFLITLQNDRDLILFIEEETGEQKQTSGFTESLAGARDNFLLR